MTMTPPTRIPRQEFEIIRRYLDGLLRDAEKVTIHKEWWDDIQDYAYVAHREYKSGWRDQAYIADATKRKKEHDNDTARSESAL